MGGCTLIFSYICRVIFWVQNFKFQYFWGVSQKNGGTPHPVRGCMLTESVLTNSNEMGKGLSSIL